MKRERAADPEDRGRMIPTRPWVLIIGAAGAVFAAAHAYTFRVIGESVSFLPEDISERLVFFAGAPVLFQVWIISAVLFTIALIAMLPAMWLALGRGWSATAVVGLVFVGCVALVFGDGSQFPTLALATRYASAPEALRPGLEAAAIDVNAAVVLVLGAGQVPLLVGVVGAVVLAAVKRPPGGRWYGLLFLLFWLANIPIPGAIVFGVLNLILFGAFTYATARALHTEATG
jgi:hypothetical protein